VNHQSSSRSAIWALLLLAAIWGYNWIQMKIAVQYASPFQFSAWRVALGGLALLAAMVWLRKPLRPKAIPETCLIGLLQTAGMYGLASWALVSGGAGKTSVLAYTMPFWTILFAWLLLGERVRGLQWWAIGLGLAGLLLILEPQQLGGTVGSKLLAILAGMSWAGGAVVAKRLRQRTQVDLFSLTTWQTVFAAVPLIAVVLLWMFVLDQLPAGTAGLGVLLNPAVAVLAAWFQLGEQPSSVETVGMVVLALALILNAVQAMRSSV
jgi:drug/metabolite transporter (DMT)-like permease